MSVNPKQRRIDRVKETRETRLEALDEQVSLDTTDPRSPKQLKSWLTRVEGRFMGEPIDVPPDEAIMWAMRVAAGEVAYCDEQIKRLSEDELFERPTKTTLTELPSGQIAEITEVRDAEVISRWVRWRDHAMWRMSQYAKMALDVGIEQRQIELAEKQAKQLVNVISAVLTDLGHDLKDIRTKDVVRRRLLEGAMIESTATEISDDSN